MKKYPPIIAGVVLGLLFVMSAVMMLFNLVKAPPPPEGSPVAMFGAAFGPTGYFTFVKIFELVGGLAVMIPRLRNFGLLLLGPVIVNIVVFHILVDDPMNMLQIKDMWILYVIVASALYLFWDARKKFANLLG